MAIKGKNAAQTFSGFVAFPKDTYRKIRKTVLIYTCGSLIDSKLGSSSITQVKGHERSYKGDVHTWPVNWNQNTTTVSINIFS